MDMPFATRMDTVPKSFIREILKVTESPEIISFAGGLPHPDTFPVQAMAEAAARVLGEQGAAAMQYSTSEGYAPLRERIAARYDKYDMKVHADDILITTGSQQGLDLIGKVMLDPGDVVLMERPGYLGAIQAFAMFQPEFVTVPLLDDGPDIDAVEAAILNAEKKGKKIKLFYAVTNFQNPSGLTYSMEKRQAITDLLARHAILFLEDNPYGELRFRGEDMPPAFALAQGPAALFGTFSKIAAPGLRVGWTVAGAELRDKLITAKQAADLHSSTLTQRMLDSLLDIIDLEAHIQTIRDRYGRQRNAMVEAMTAHFPENVRFTSPDGGMFLWATLPDGVSAMDLFHEAVKRKVAFVPGAPFYVNAPDERTFRLNFSNASEETIHIGIERLGQSLESFLG